MKVASTIKLNFPRENIMFIFFISPTIHPNKLSDKDRIELKRKEFHLIIDQIECKYLHAIN